MFGQLEKMCSWKLRMNIIISEYDFDQKYVLPVYILLENFIYYINMSVVIAENAYK